MYRITYDILLTFVKFKLYIKGCEDKYNCKESSPIYAILSFCLYFFGDTIISYFIAVFF